MNPFREALEGWTEEQWYKGGARDAKNDTRTCAIIRLADTGCPWSLLGRADDVARELFPDRVGRSFNVCDTAQVNDHPDTTFEDVVQVLEKAAVRWDEQL